MISSFKSIKFHAWIDVRKEDRKKVGRFLPSAKRQSQSYSHPDIHYIMLELCLLCITHHRGARQHIIVDCITIKAIHKHERRDEEKKSNING